MNIVQKIDEIRVKRGWTFYKLSQESGLSQQTFTKWMEGKTTPTISALQSVCDAFGITLSNFFAENDILEITPQTKELFENWNYLTKDEQMSIKLIVENYLKRKQ